MDVITILIGSLGGGGAERICVTLANGFCQRDIKVDLLVLQLDDEVYMDNLAPEINLLNLDVGHARRSMHAIASYCLKHRPNSILVFNHQLAIILILLRMFTSLRFRIIARTINTLSVQSLNQRSLWHGRIVNGLTRIFYRKADIVIAQSEGMANDMRDSYRIKTERLKVIPNPLNPDIESHVGLETGRRRILDYQYILCVGRLEKQKAFQVAIRAFHQVQIRHPDIKLVIIGEGSMRDDLDMLIEDLGLTGNISLLGYKQDTTNYYQDAALTLLTSLYEGFPNVLVESMALGTPVVANDCKSGPGEIIEDGVNGYLAGYQDTDDLALKINLALDKEWDCSVISGTVRKFNADEVTEQYTRYIL